MMIIACIISNNYILYFQLLVDENYDLQCRIRKTEMEIETCPVSNNLLTQIRKFLYVILYFPVD